MRGLWLKALCFAVVASALPSAAIAQVQIDQNFVPQGPAQGIISDQNFFAQGLSPFISLPVATTSGAVQAILAHKALGPDTMLLGSTSGGIWKTTDGGMNWKPLTENQSLLSIASLGLDATDPMGKTLIAGTGITSSGNWGPALSPSNQGPPGNLPLLYSTSGGEDWMPLAGATKFANQSVIGVAASRQTIMAATFEERQPKTEAGYGLYISQNGGESFSLGASGLPAGPVTALVADQSDPNHSTFYAAVTKPNPTVNDNPIGVYVTTNSGMNWSPVFTNATTVNGGTNVITGTTEQLVLKLASGPYGSVAIVVVNAETNEIDGLYLAQNQGGTTWSASAIGGNLLTDPNGINQGDPSGVLHTGVAIDPNSPSGSPIVYLASSDITDPPYTTPTFRIQGQHFKSLTCPRVTTGSNKGDCINIPGQPTGTAHADTRVLVVDPATGNLLMGNDGGITMRTNPQSDDGAWSELNNTLQISEPYAVAYGANAQRLMLAVQDNGVAIQSAPNSPLYFAVGGGDGHNAVVREVHDKTLGPVSVYYFSSQDLGDLTRLVVDGEGKIPHGTPPTGVPVTCSLGILLPEDCGAVTSGGAIIKHDDTIALNKHKDHERLVALTSGLDVYVAQDDAPANAKRINLSLTTLPILIPSDAPPVKRALAYGASDNPYALLAGGGISVPPALGGGTVGFLYLSTNAQPGNPNGSMEPLPAYTLSGGALPTSLVFGQSSQEFYVADGVTLWGTASGGGTTFTNYTKELSDLSVTGPTSVEFINNNGVDALVVGGLMSCPSGICASSQSPIAVADSNDGMLQDFRPFGAGLPNALVSQISYNKLADVLAIASVGRGVWTLYDVTSYFPQATTLQFGLADHDSLPDASFLTDGTNLDGTTFVRPLHKYGAGTLTIAGNASHTGGTSIFDGILQLGNGGASGSVLGDVSFCSDATNPLCNYGANKFLVFDRSDTYSFDGTISGPGQLVQNGLGTTILTGANTYMGPTWVNQGALIVNGSIVSPVAVNFGGLLGGSGSVGATAIGYGSVLAPGNSIGTLTVNGNLTLYPGALYEVEANAQGKSDKVIVKGTVNLTGATLFVLAASGAYKPKTNYVIIDNDGNDAVNGKFDQVLNTLAFLIPSVVYDGGSGNDVVLTLERNSSLFKDVAKTRNQRAVAGALDQFPTDDALFLTVLNQTEEGARQAFDALSGEIHATVAGTLADDSRYVREAVLGRLMQAGHRGESLAAGGPQVALIDSQAMMLGDGASLYDGKSLIEPAPAPLAFWTRAFGAWGDFDTDGNAASGDRDLGGFISGMDANIGGSWRGGLATGASFSNVAVDARYSSADVETYHLGGYVGGMAGAFALRGGGMWAWNDIETSRAVIFPGFYERQTASYDADTGQLFGEIAYPTQMGGIGLEPFGGLAFVSIDSDRFRERGGALASLRGEADQDVGYSTVGLRAATTKHWGAMLVSPHVSAAWQHAFDDVTPDAALVFASNGIGFTVYGVPLAEDSALIDAGLDFALGERTTAGVSYSGQFGDGVTDNGVKGRFTWLF